MSRYIVKMHEDRNIVIEANSFDLTNMLIYRFLKDGKVVAMIAANQTVGIVEEEAHVADYYDHYDLSLPDEDDDPFTDPEPVREIKIKAKVECRKVAGRPVWGVSSHGFFVPFSSREKAESSSFLKDSENLEGYYYEPLSECPLVEAA